MQVWCKIFKILASLDRASRGKVIGGKRSSTEVGLVCCCWTGQLAKLTTSNKPRTYFYGFLLFGV